MHENRKEVVTVHSTHSGRGILLVFFRKKSQRTKNLVCGHIHAHLQKGNKIFHRSGLSYKIWQRRSTRVR